MKKKSSIFLQQLQLRQVTLSLKVMADQLTCGFDNRLKKEIK